MASSKPPSAARLASRSSLVATSLAKSLTTGAMTLSVTGRPPPLVCALSLQVCVLSPEVGALSPEMGALSLSKGAVAHLDCFRRAMRQARESWMGPPPWTVCDGGDGARTQQRGRGQLGARPVEILLRYEQVEQVEHEELTMLGRTGRRAV